IVPLAGKDENFESRGMVKPLTKIKGKEIIKLISESRPFSYEKAIFIILREHQEKYNLENELKKLFGDGLIFSFSRKLSSHSRRIQWAYGPIILDNNYKKEVADVLTKFLILKKYSFIGHQHPLDDRGFSTINFIGKEFNK
ncbi:hypothetical protein LCGC14_2709740, partial [marine sediment metagenome]